MGTKPTRKSPTPTPLVNEEKNARTKKEIIFQEGKPELLINNQIISLTSVEYQMMKLLVQENNIVITRDQFLNVLYTFSDEAFDRVIDVHIRNIQLKKTAIIR